MSKDEHVCQTFNASLDCSTEVTSYKQYMKPIHTPNSMTACPRTETVVHWGVLILEGPATCTDQSTQQFLELILALKISYKPLPVHISTVQSLNCVGSSNTIPCVTCSKSWCNYGPTVIYDGPGYCCLCQLQLRSTQAIINSALPNTEATSAVQAL